MKSQSNPGFFAYFSLLIGNQHLECSAEAGTPYPCDLHEAEYLLISPSLDCTQITISVRCLSTVFLALTKVLLNFKVWWLFFLVTVRIYKLIVYLCTIKFSCILYVLCTSHWLDPVCPEFREASIVFLYKTIEINVSCQIWRAMKPQIHMLCRSTFLMITSL